MDGRILKMGVVLILVVAAVLFMSQSESNSATASEIRDMSVSMSKKIYSYSYSITVTSNSKGRFEGKQIDIETMIKGNGTIDLRKRFMKNPVSFSVKGYSGEELIETDSNMEMYILYDTLYSKVGDDWVKQKMTGDAWNNTQLDQQTEMVKNASAIFLGEETWRGVDCYIIQFKPDLKKLLSYAVEITASTPSVGASLKKETIEGYAIKEWISKESYLPLKTTTEFIVVSNDVKTVMSINAEYYDYNKPVTAELPAEASKALEL